MRIHLKYLAYLFLLVQCITAHAGAYEDFFRAVNVDDSRTVAALLQRGFDPNSIDEQGQVGLYLALRADAPKVVAILLAHPAIKADVANAAGETPLMMAALRGEVDAMRRLIDLGAQVNRPGWSPLHYAASGPSLEALQLLMSRGAAIEARSPNGTTPVMMAARYGSDDAALALVRGGADTRTKNDKGLDAAEFARLGGRERLAVTLANAPH